MQGLLLGKNTPVVDQYAPELLFPIPRAAARAQLGLSENLPFHGVDLWHAYEFSWLNACGKPEARVGRFTVPVGSPNMVESKSFKLYLNSLNSARFESEEEARAVVVSDVSKVAGATVSLELLEVDDKSLAGCELPGACLDQIALEVDDVAPQASLLVREEGLVEEQFYSHLLRSLCPVTGQPDWASVWINYRGPGINRESLLRYIIAFRRHQEFHEQCVERMFTDIHSRFAPGLLEIQAFYTRRGGMDINPFRSTDPGALPKPRLNRQ
jgi:7-cyano-7-deazaguanine reductase